VICATVVNLNKKRPHPMQNAGKSSCKCIGSNVLFDSTLGYPGEGWGECAAAPARCLDFEIVTYSASGWAGALQCLQDLPETVQIVLLQEIRTRHDQVPGRALQAQKVGWQIHFAASNTTLAGGVSSGVATAHRPHLRLLGPATPIWEHRCLSVTIHTARYGPLQVANLYQDVYASDEQKYSHLARLWDRLRMVPGRPIIGGDSTCTPTR